MVKVQVGPPTETVIVENSDYCGFFFALLAINHIIFTSKAKTFLPFLIF